MGAAIQLEGLPSVQSQDNETRAVGPPDTRAGEAEPPTLASHVDPRDEPVLSEGAGDLRVDGVAAEQLTQIVAAFNDQVGELYSDRVITDDLGDFSGVLGNALGALNTLQGKENTGCKFTQLTTYQAISALTSLESDEWQAAPVRIGAGPFVHNAVAIWSSDVAFEDADPQEVLMLDPWPQQGMEDSVRTLEEWQGLPSLTMMLGIGGLREVDLH